MANISRAVDRVSRELVSFADADPWVKILVYGRHGRGKTRFGASGPDVVLLDINEKGTKSVRRIRGKVFRARKWDQVTWFFWYLKYGRHKHRTVVIDNLTTLQTLCMKQILREAEDRDPNRDPKMAEMRHWGKLKEMMGPLILDFRNLDMHVVFLAQERVDRNSEDDAPERVPDMSPGVRGIALGSVDVIGRIYQREVRIANRRTRTEETAWRTLMLVGPHDEFITKDRTFNLGRIVVNPTMGKVIKAAQSMED